MTDEARMRELVDKYWDVRMWRTLSTKLGLHEALAEAYQAGLAARQAPPKLIADNVQMIGFLRSCVLSGENLSSQDEAEISSLIKRLNGQAQ